MTRINVGIPPQELCDQHLLAEYRELPRMVAFAQARAARYHGTGPVPPVTLGTGHMTSLLPAGAYLASRHQQIREEMHRRQMTVEFSQCPFADRYPFMGDLEVSQETVQALRQRIQSRLRTMKRIPTWTNRRPPLWADCVRFAVKTKGSVPCC